MKIIDLQEIAVSYVGKAVLSDFSLSVDRGEIVGIYGPNGSGKSTVLTAVNGLVKISRGQVFINQTRLTERNGTAIRKNIGYVPQYLEVDVQAPVLAGEVVLMGRYGKLGVFHNPQRTDWEIAREMMDKLEITHLRNRPFGQLSGGEKKRFLMARSLTQEPNILLLDEAFAWLDEKIREKVQAFLSEIQATSQLTVLVVAHEKEILEGLCSRIVYMEEGKIIKSESRME